MERRETHPLVAQLLDTRPGDFTELLVRADPELGVDFVLGHQLAFEQVAHEEVVVHCLCDDLGDRLGGHLDVCVVF